MDVLGCHPQQYLAGAAEFAELLEDEPDDLLQPSIGIKTETNMAVPAIADRCRDPQFTSPRLRSCCVVHPRSNDTQLKLADAAFHAEQQAIIGAARIINAVEVDDTGFH